MAEAERMYEDDESLVPKDMTTYFHGLLLRGSKWSPEETDETERVQEAHLAHIRRMFEDGDLVIAGPFTDDGDIRGVFIFRTGTIEEAQALAAADPAVKSGRLIVEIHPWMVPSGVLP
jgi:uncharacterized protein YciI